MKKRPVRIITNAATGPTARRVAAAATGPAARRVVASAIPAAQAALHRHESAHRDGATATGVRGSAQRFLMSGAPALLEQVASKLNDDDTVSGIGPSTSSLAATNPNFPEFGRLRAEVIRYVPQTWELRAYIEWVRQSETPMTPWQGSDPAEHRDVLIALCQMVGDPNYMAVVEFDNAGVAARRCTSQQV